VAYLWLRNFAARALPSTPSHLHVPIKQNNYFNRATRCVERGDKELAEKLEQDFAVPRMFDKDPGNKKKNFNSYRKRKGIVVPCEGRTWFSCRNGRE
jgi:hypothetical protein